jgi:phenylacetate-CoA ligase
MRASDRFFELSPLWLRTLLLNAHASRLARFREGAPLQEKIRILEELDRAERLTVARYQLERINELLAWAGERVPYYRAAWGGGAPRLGSLEDLGCLPELTKAAVREAGSALHSVGVASHGGHTSGTTGTPLHLAYDREQRVWNRAAERLVRIRAGLRLDDPVAVVWGRKVVPPGRKRPPYWLRNAVDKELWLSAFHLAPKTVSQYVDAIQGFGAVALETYPSIAYVLAVLARDRNVKLRLARVLTTSETLYPFQRALIEEVFGAEVYDYYGAAERVAFAIECGRHDGLHLLEGFGYVEPAAASSCFVVTGMTNRAMPLIRYRVEDATELIDAPCSCGLTSRRLSPVTTKAEDILVTPDGRLVSPSILTHAFKPLVGLVRSQVVQEAIDRVQVYLETGPDWDPRQEESIVSSLGERMGPGVRIEVHRVDRLEQTAAGKFRWVVCKVPRRDRPAQLQQGEANR